MSAYNHTGCLEQLTGGCSSTFSPVSGFALKFANTPSDPDPPPYTLPVVLTGSKTGKCVGVLCTIGRGVSFVVVVIGSLSTFSVDELAGVPRINLCLSSPSFSSSLSDPSASKVSARFWSSTLCRDVGEEARERKDGGGEAGMVGLVGVSASLTEI